MALHRRVRGRGDLRVGGDVRLVPRRARAALRGDRGQRLRLQPHERDVPPARGQGASRRRSDPARSAGDEDDAHATSGSCPQEGRGTLEPTPWRSLTPSPEPSRPTRWRATPSCSPRSCTRSSSSRAATRSPTPSAGCTSAPASCATASPEPAGAARAWSASCRPTSVEPCIRACALQLQLANIAEERERVRRRRHYDATGVRQRESLMEAARPAARGRRRPRRRRALAARSSSSSPRTRPRRRGAPCSTTSCTSPACSTALDDPRIGRSRRRALLAELREALTLWWQTDEVRRVRPMVEDEVRRNLFFFEAVALRRRARGARGARALLRGARRRPRARRSARWAGSDMDGHPEVGAETLARTLTLHRAAAAAPAAPPRRPARAALLALAPPHAPSRPRCSTSLERDAAELPSARVLRRANREYEPLRTKLGFITHRLVNMLDPLAREPGYADPQELRDDLWLVLDSVGSAHVAHGAIRRLLWQVDVFGFHVASLDVRQSASVVQEAVAALLPGYRDADERRAPAAARGGDHRGPARASAGDPTASRASCCACSTPSRWRATPTAPRAVPGDGHLDGRSAPSDVLAALWLARRAGARLRLGAAVRDARRPDATRRRRWRALYDTPRLPRLACARTATAS